MNNSREPDIYIWDVTLRDGEQTPGVVFKPEDKIALAKAMNDVGIQYADISFPANSDQEVEATKAISNLNLSLGLNVTARMKIDEVDLAIDCGIKEINMMAPASDIHIEKKFKLSKPDIEQMVEGVFKYAHRKGVKINFIAEDTARADPKYAIEIMKRAHDLGADKLVICDTVGVMDPQRMGDLTDKIISACDSNAKFAVHCHNDYGLAVANSLAAVAAGVKYVTVTINGIGERSGNAALEQTVMALERVEGLHTGIDTTKLYSLSKLAEKRSGIPIGVIQPIVGFNVTRHESGIHVAAMLEETSTYEAFDPALVGRERVYVLGKHSGKNQVAGILDEHGIVYTPAELNEINQGIKDYATSKSGINKVSFLRQHDSYCEKQFGVPEDKFMEITEKVLNERK